MVRAMPWTASPDCGTATTNRVAVSAMVSDAGNRTPAASARSLALRHDSRTLSAGVLAPPGLPRPATLGESGVEPLLVAGAQAALGPGVGPFAGPGGHCARGST